MDNCKGSLIAETLFHSTSDQGFKAVRGAFWTQIISKLSKEMPLLAGIPMRGSFLTN